jgi:hypothetical protein
MAGNANAASVRFRQRQTIAGNASNKNNTQGLAKEGMPLDLQLSSQGGNAQVGITSGNQRWRIDQITAVPD